MKSAILFFDNFIVDPMGNILNRIVVFNAYGEHAKSEFGLYRFCLKLMITS